ncbi:hypothetical protein [Nostoc sp.]|uniref:hypothetical protein n=1 Tax=Nostoc sp. TaxID=1180 RepID=UPI002FF95025
MSNIDKIASTFNYSVAGQEQLLTELTPEEGATISGSVNFNGQWNAYQSNSAIVSFNTRQLGTKIVGSGSTGSSVGTGEGTLNGNQFFFRIFWNYGSIGVYQGTVNDQGTVAGISYDETNPSSQATWFSP